MPPMSPVERPSSLDVLVVDDDPAVARLVRVVLEREGLTVEHAHDAATAFQLLENALCRLILTDYTMPEVSGLDLVRQFEAKGVRATYLIMSAFLEPIVVSQICAEPAVAGVIRKPFELKELTRDVRSVLGMSVETEREEPKDPSSVGVDSPNRQS